MSENHDPSDSDESAAPPSGNAPQAPSLASFEGGSGPTIVSAAWRAYCEFEEPLRRELPHLIQKVLEDPADPANDGRFNAFCSHFSVPRETLSEVVQGLNLLIGHASALGIEVAAIRSDLIALGGGETNQADPIVKLYEVVRPMLRTRLVEQTLSDHGRLLTGVDWRVDELKVSDRGAGLDTSVMHLTLRYREGNETSRISLQLVPEMARRLRDACARVVS